jgi:hypothetical protein
LATLSLLREGPGVLMKKRVTVLGTIFACVALVAALAFGAVACGSGGDTSTTAAPGTTAAPQTTTSGAGSDTTAASTGTSGTTATSAAAVTTTSAAGTDSTTGSSIAVTPEMEKYKTDMMAFAQALMSLPSAGDPSKFTDLSKLTEADTQAATAFIGVIHEALDKLKAIQPPAEFAALHQQLVDGIDKMVEVTDKAMAAVLKKDQAAFDAAKTEGEAVAAGLEGLIEQLSPVFGMGTTAAS